MRQNRLARECTDTGVLKQQQATWMWLSTFSRVWIRSKFSAYPLIQLLSLHNGLITWDLLLSEFTMLTLFSFLAPETWRINTNFSFFLYKTDSLNLIFSRYDSRIKVCAVAPSLNGSVYYWASTICVCEWLKQPVKWSGGVCNIF